MSEITSYHRGTSQPAPPGVETLEPIKLRFQAAGLDDWLVGAADGDHDVTPGEAAILAYKNAVTPDPFWICRECGTSTTDTWYLCPACEKQQLPASREQRAQA